MNIQKIEDVIALAVLEGSECNREEGGIDIEKAKQVVAKNTKLAMGFIEAQTSLAQVSAMVMQGYCHRYGFDRQPETVAKKSVIQAAHLIKALQLKNEIPSNQLQQRDDLGANSGPQNNDTPQDQEQEKR